MKNPNGYGTVIKLAGNRRKPYACRKTTGFNEKGYPIYKYISYHKTKREAMEALREYNRDPYNLNKITFEDAFERWMDFKGYEGRSEDRYRNAFRYCEPLRDVYMNDLSLSRLQIFFDDVIATAAILDSIKMMITGVIDYSVKRNVLPMSMHGVMDLVDLVPRKETHKVERKIFTKEEIEDLWIRNGENIPKLVLFYIYTGLRFSELANLKPDNWHDNYIVIPKAKTAAGIREVPLSDKALSLLPLPVVPPARTFNEKLNKFNHTPHDTRHTFISLMTEAGVDSRILKKIVGHVSNDVTEKIYTHISLEVMLEAVNRI